jgi:hypothetical protein
MNEGMSLNSGTHYIILGISYIIHTFELYRAGTEFTIINDTLCQTATFRSLGLWGRLYWYSLNALNVDPSLHIDPSAAFIKDFIPLPQRENILKRVMGTLGLEMRKAEPE